MVDVMFTAASRIMRLVGGFACAPRRRARLPLSVSVIEMPRRSYTGLPRTISGFLKDISETGVGLLVPTIRLGDCYLTGINRQLSIAIDLAGSPIHLEAQPVRYEKLEQDDGASVSYLIGARITEMSEGNRARFNAYLKTLR